MSAGSSPMRQSEATSALRDSAGYEWEEVAVPAMTPTPEGENPLPPRKTAVQVSG